MLTWDEFMKVDLRAGTIIAAAPLDGAKKPAIRLLIDFGPLGQRRSSAQIAANYDPADLIGKQVVAVVNFPPKQIGKFMSEVLVTGFPDEHNNVVLSTIDRNVPNGARLF